MVTGVHSTERSIYITESYLYYQTGGDYGDKAAHIFCGDSRGGEYKQGRREAPPLPAAPYKAASAFGDGARVQSF